MQKRVFQVSTSVPVLDCNTQHCQSVCQRDGLAFCIQRVSHVTAGLQFIAGDYVSFDSPLFLHKFYLFQQGQPTIQVLLHELITKTGAPVHGIAEHVMLLLDRSLHIECSHNLQDNSS